MYDKIEGGTCVNVQGVDCWVPPVPEDKTSILNFGKDEEDQKWIRTELPVFKAYEVEWFSGDEPEDPNEEVDWDTARREEIIKQTGADPSRVDRLGNPTAVSGVEADEDYCMDVLEDFRLQEYDRVFKGVWIYVKGNPIYITGIYYFYLNWWKMDTGYPEFRVTDMHLFYFIQVAIEDPRCFGVIYITKRGSGKSFIAGCLAYYHTITYKQVHCGIQSKTDGDAEELFLKKVAEPYKDLPDFLIPVNKHGTNPTNELNFSPQSRRGKSSGSHRKEQKTALRSTLDYKSSKEIAYDGTSLKFIVHDEMGKTDPAQCDVVERLRVVRECVYRDSRKRGIIFCTTTVEKMESGGEQCKKIWYDSNLGTRSSNGRTKSWLYPFFISAIEGSFFDEYGYPLPEKAKRIHDGERANMEDDPEDLVSYIQKNPYTIEEAFMTQGSNCVYHAAILQKAQKRLSSAVSASQYVIKGDFYWMDGEKDTKVEFVRNDDNGKWEISYLDIPDNESNMLTPRGEVDVNGQNVMQWSVKKSGKRAIGYDPYAAKKTVYKDKQSNAGITVIQGYDFHTPDEYCNTIIADYAGREHDPKITHEQVIMAAVFFGAEVLVENNKLGGIEYIEDRGYSDILMERPSASGTKDSYAGIVGIPSGTNTINYYVEETKTFVKDFGEKLNHLRVVRDWLDFDPQNTTKFDSGVSASLAVVAIKKPAEEYEEVVDISNFLPTFDHSNSSSKMN